MRIEFKVNERTWFVEFGEEAGRGGGDTQYRLTLLGVEGTSMIPLIKELRQHFNLGLKEAKNLVDNVPSELGVFPKSQAMDILLTLRPYGKVTVKAV